MDIKFLVGALALLGVSWYVRKIVMQLVNENKKLKAELTLLKKSLKNSGGKESFSGKAIKLSELSDDDLEENKNKHKKPIVDQPGSSISKLLSSFGGANKKTKLIPTTITKKTSKNKLEKQELGIGSVGDTVEDVPVSEDNVKVKLVQQCDEKKCILKPVKQSSSKNDNDLFSEPDANPISDSVNIEDMEGDNIFNHFLEKSNIESNTLKEASNEDNSDNDSLAGSIDDAKDSRNLLETVNEDEEDEMFTKQTDKNEEDSSLSNYLKDSESDLPVVVDNKQNEDIVDSLSRSDDSEEKDNLEIKTNEIFVNTFNNVIEVSGGTIIQDQLNDIVSQSSRVELIESDPETSEEPLEEEDKNSLEDKDSSTLKSKVSVCSHIFEKGKKTGQHCSIRPLAGKGWCRLHYKKVKH